MKLHEYYTLSNIEAYKTTPCYITNYNYFFKKLGAAETYYFLHLESLDPVLHYFNIVHRKKEIKKLIRARKSDEQIIEIIGPDIKPEPREPGAKYKCNRHLGMLVNKILRFYEYEELEFIDDPDYVLAYKKNNWLGLSRKTSNL